MTHHNKTTLFVPLTLIFCLITTIGCSTPIAKPSGFLSDYSKLKPSKLHDDNLYYQNPKTDFSKYKFLYLNPIKIHFAPNKKGTTVSPNDLKTLTDYFAQQITKPLDENSKFKFIKEINDHNISQTIILDVAITGLEPSNPLLNIHPATKITAAGVGGASFEAQASDAKSNQTLVSLVETRTGYRMSFGTGLSTWGHTKAVMEYWGKRFRNRLLEAKTKNKK